MTRARSRPQTERRILDAINTLLASEGYAALGVNRVAKQAGVDKVLIYRYFGGLEGALRAWATTAEFWPDPDEIIGMSREDFSRLDYLQQRKTLTINTLRALRRRPQLLSIMAWERVAGNELTRIMADIRVRQSEELHALLKSPPGEGASIDNEVVDLVIGAAVHHLALMASTGTPAYGVNAGISWERIEACLAFIQDGIALAELRVGDTTTAQGLARSQASTSS